MPFKTKKKKTRAEKKRVEISQEGLAIYRGSDSAQITESGLQGSPLVKPHLDVNDYSYVSFELAKILMIASLIIGLQLILKLSNITF